MKWWIILVFILLPPLNSVTDVNLLSKTHCAANFIVWYNSNFSSVSLLIRHTALEETNSWVSFLHFRLCLFCSVVVAHSKLSTLLSNLLWFLWFIVSLFSGFAIKCNPTNRWTLNAFRLPLTSDKDNAKYPDLIDGFNILFVILFLMLPSLLT